MKRITYTIALLIGLVSVSFASNGGDKKNPVAKPDVMLSAEEAALEAELNIEFEISVADVLAEVSAEPMITSVKVFDMTGNDIAAQNGTIDFSKIPANAELLMTEGTTRYFIVTE